MKTQKFLLAIGLTVCVCMPLSAQLNVQANGGVRIGQTPSDGWTLTSKGLEVAAGDLLFHAPGGGTLQLETEMIWIYSNSKGNIGGKSTDGLIGIGGDLDFGIQRPSTILTGSY